MNVTNLDLGNKRVVVARCARGCSNMTTRTPPCVIVKEMSARFHAVTLPEPPILCRQMQRSYNRTKLQPIEDGRTCPVRWTKNLRTLGILLGCLLAGQHLHGQDVTGRWSTYGREMWNGERDRSVLVLVQTNGAISGTFESMTGKTKVRGTIAGNHFEIFAWDPSHPSVVGELVVRFQ